MSEESGREPGAGASGNDAPAPEGAPPITAQAAAAEYVPPSRRAASFVRDYLAEVRGWGQAYFLGRDPTFWSALGVFAVLSVILYSRWFTTNFIFDEQEALLANPYVNATQNLRFVDAIHRDFWGLLPDRSIGSYRPIPNFLWRALWSLSKTRDGVFHQAFFHHIENVLLHGVNAALMTVVAFAWTRRRGLAWVAGLIFAACAVITEAVSGIVGIADVLGGMGALLALWALSAPAYAMPFAVFMAVSFGLFSKESALVCVPLIPFAALLVAPLTHPGRPARFARAALAFVGAATAFYLYVELRKRWFPSPLPRELKEALPEDATWVKRTAHDFLVWFHQAPLPKDPLNNPLVDAEPKYRIAGALRVYFRGLVQVVYPRPLSGDYSFPQEPAPDRLIFPESVAGAVGMIAPPLLSALLFLVALYRERKARIAASLAGLGERGDLAGALFKGLAVLLLLVAPAIALAALARGEDIHDRLSAGSPLVLGPPVLAALAWVSAAVMGHLRARAPGADRGRLPLRIAGLALVALAITAAALDLLYLRPLGRQVAYRGLPLWVAAVPLATLGAGLLIEGAPAVADPFAASTIPLGGRALGIAGVSVFALGITWIVVSYFPHSNIPVVLPTVRAERFWYFPVIGSTLALSVLFTWLFEIELRVRRAARVIPVLFGLFIGFQCFAAYGHAMDYRSDLDFWRATKDAVPRSSKAHLNYSVMKGARGDLETRLVESKIAMSLAPRWAMAHIYTGDTLCRLHRAPEAWEHYARGFDIGPNDQSLIALALQCLYDEKELMSHEDELRTIAATHEGSWIAYLAIDTLQSHEKNKGVDPKYRPRGYNDGPKGD